MFYHLFPQLAEYHIVFNVFRYITFRTAGAVVTALLVAFVIGPRMIDWLTHLKVGEVVREEGDGPDHAHKAGTPTMGGVIIILAAALSTFLWADLTNRYTLVALAALLWMGALGFWDDWLKVIQKRKEGLVARYKMAGQWSFALGLGVVLLLWPMSDLPTTQTSLPFFSDWSAVFWPPAFVVFVGLVISGTSNAVNLTDGLDGLAAGLMAIAAATFGVLAYVTGRFDTSAYLGLFYLPGSGELAIFCLALAGGAMGFLWYNAHPAQVFMGDTGSLAVGGALGVVAILLKLEFLLAIIGGVFVLEAFSVMAQVVWFKATKRRFGEGRRIFRMTPIHHHFEELGWHETKVVTRFWILGILCAMVAISTLKIR